MDPQTKLSVNRPALLSCAGIAGAILFSPGADHVMIDWFPSATFSVMAVLGAAGAVAGYRNRRLLRRSIRRARKASGVLGDARFASLRELQRAGMLDPTSGPLLCTVDVVPVFLPKGKHYFLEGPSGSGKSSSIAVAMIFHLVHLGYSVTVSDLKPELCHIIAPELKRRGFRVRYNNPARIGGLPHDDANPFAPLADAVFDPDQRGQAFPLAESYALEITPEGERQGADNQYFRNLERQLFVVMVLALAAIDRNGCIPSVVHRHASDPLACLGLLTEISESDALNGDLAAEARGLINLHDRHPEHFEGARTGLANALSAFRTSSDLGLLGATASFDPKDMRDESEPPMVVFDLVPAASPETYVKALALQTIARMHVLKTRAGRRIAFCLDEATNLPVRSISKEITLMRSRGALIAMMVQSRSELERVYGEKQAATILGNTVEQYLQVGDSKLAEFISKRIGEHTVVTTSRSFTMKDGEASKSVSEQARPLMPVDEVMAMPSDSTLIFVPGMRPILGKRLSYFHAKPFKDWAEPNPQEPYPPSPITKVELRYGKDASDHQVPEVVGLPKLLKASLRSKTKRAAEERLPFLEWSAFRWVPIVGAFATVITFVGTPHVLYEYTMPRDGSVRQCTYAGVSGLVTQTAGNRCRYVIMHRGWEAWRNR